VLCDIRVKGLDRHKQSNLLVPFKGSKEKEVFLIDPGLCNIKRIAAVIYGFHIKLVFFPKH
jgi:hypothetical protein